MGRDKESYHGRSPETQGLRTRVAELEFSTPILFGKDTSQFWRVPSDTLFRGIVSAASMLYGKEVVSEFLGAADHKSVAFSSLILIKKSKMYFPHFSMKAYVTMDESGIVDSSELIGAHSMVRIPRGESVEPEPYEYSLLETQRYRWAIIFSAGEGLSEKLVSSIRFLGETGLGSRRSRGFGKFKVLSVNDENDYGVKASNSGFLAARYKPVSEGAVKGDISVENIVIYYGPERRYEFAVIAEGSKILQADGGVVHYVKNDLGLDVPVLLTPILLRLVA